MKATGSELSKKFFQKSDLNDVIKLVLTDDKFAQTSNKPFMAEIKNTLMAGAPKPLSDGFNNLLVCGLIVIFDEVFEPTNEGHQEIVKRLFDYIIKHPHEFNNFISVVGYAKGLVKGMIIQGAHLRDLSHRCKELAELQDLIQKYNLNEMKDADSKERKLISLEDLGKMRHLSKLQDSLKKIMNSNAMKGTKMVEPLILLQEMIKPVIEIFPTIKKNFGKLLSNGQVNVGDIGFNSITKVAKVNASTPDTFLTMMRWMSDYGHTFLVDSSEKEAKIIDILSDRMKSNSLLLEDYLSSDYFRIDILALINSHQMEKLKPIFGKEKCEKFLTAQFEKIRNQIFHETLEWKGVTAHEEKMEQVKHALKLSLISIPNLHLEVMNMTRKNYQPPPKMLCSEFVARRILLAIYKFNEFILQSSSIPGCPGGIKDAARFPFNDKQDITGISPRVLYRELHAAGCLKPIDHQEVFAEMGLAL